MSCSEKTDSRANDEENEPHGGDNHASEHDVGRAFGIADREPQALYLQLR
jgi:hypothetical protein